MSMSFTKLFSSITESSVWFTPAPTRLVWITMLAMADRHGRVYGSIPGLAHRARVTVDECREAIECFKSPDPDSRTKDFEGRRIFELDGGWELINYAKHRAIQNDESIRASKRNYMQRQREQWKSSSTVENLPLDLDLLKEEEPPKRKPKRGPLSHFVPETWAPTDKHRERAKAMSTSAFDAEVSKFRNWEFKTPRSDWNRAFTNWLDSALERQPLKPAKPSADDWAEDIKRSFVR